MALLVLPVVFSCGRDDNGYDQKKKVEFSKENDQISDEGKVRIEFIPKNVSVSPNAQTNIIATFVGNNLDALKIPNIDWNTQNGIKQMFDSQGNDWDDRVVKSDPLLEQAITYQSIHKSSNKHIIIEPNHPVKKLRIQHLMQYTDNKDDLGILKMKIYVDNKLKVSSSITKKYGLLSAFYFNTVKKLRKLPDIKE